MPLRNIPPFTGLFSLPAFNNLQKTGRFIKRLSPAYIEIIYKFHNINNAHLHAK
ncbi:hypothetical protein DCCM_4419 [Desulfocucumis palustris]|uniref:Uncharacterized protein n=1 Tax=Desulfocucumis palustris TaxID=1898651 RepID=A0A2L2XLV9_9FIRM|nr:hypothetical protein DCCM_4419 [Desulfocucumis palustris]